MAGAKEFLVVIRAMAAMALITASSITLAATASTTGAHKPGQTAAAKTATRQADEAGSNATAGKPAPQLISTVAWNEKVTVTVGSDGEAQSCQFVSSLRPAGATDCTVVSGEKAMAGHSSAKDEYTRITFERRFAPGTQPDSGNLPTGDTLLGRQVMALAIDGKGAVKGCRIVAKSGDMTPDYGCDEASAERFETSAGTARSSEREATMTVLVYGHSEHVV